MTEVSKADQLLTSAKKVSTLNTRITGRQATAKKMRDDQEIDENLIAKAEEEVRSLMLELEPPYRVAFLDGSTVVQVELGRASKSRPRRVLINRTTVAK